MAETGETRAFAVYEDDGMSVRGGRFCHNGVKIVPLVGSAAMFAVEESTLLNMVCAAIHEEIRGLPIDGELLYSIAGRFERRLLELGHKVVCEPHRMEDGTLIPCAETRKRRRL